jgi:hypothetical protein
MANELSNTIKIDDVDYNINAVKAQKVEGTLTVTIENTDIKPFSYDGSENVAVDIPVDTGLDINSKNPVQNKVVTGKLNEINQILAEKAPESHASEDDTYGTASASCYGHAKASSTTPTKAGTASVGTETDKFARGDHRHPIDTSRAAASDLIAHKNSTDVHITPAERTKWNLAQPNVQSNWKVSDESSAALYRINQLN